MVAGKAGEAHPLQWLPSREETGAKTTGRLVLEAGSALPVMLGAAFTQNNINTVVSGAGVDSSPLHRGKCFSFLLQRGSGEFFFILYEIHTQHHYKW